MHALPIRHVLSGERREQSWKLPPLSTGDKRAKESSGMRIMLSGSLLELHSVHKHLYGRKRIGKCDLQWVLPWPLWRCGGVRGQKACAIRA